MPHLARHLFTLSALVALIVGIAVCVLWAESHKVDPDLNRGHDPVALTPLVSTGGRAAQAFAWKGAAHVYVSFTTPRDLREQQDVWDYLTRRWHRSPDRRTIHAQSSSPLWTWRSGTGYYHLATDLWVPAALATLLPAC